MKNRLNMLMMLGIMAFGSYISYDALKQSAPKAEVLLPRFVDVERPKEVALLSTINIDLNSEEVTVEGTANATINITKKDEKPQIKTVWKTKVVKEQVVVDNRPAPYLVKPFMVDTKLYIPNVEPLMQIK